MSLFFHLFLNGILLYIDFYWMWNLKFFKDFSPHCLPASVISVEKFVFILIAVSSTCDVLVFSGCFQNFCLIFICSHLFIIWIVLNLFYLGCGELLESENLYLKPYLVSLQPFFSSDLFFVN